jgi:hypothetical protein
LRFEPGRLKINLETSGLVVADPDADLVVRGQPEDRSGQTQRIDGKAKNSEKLKQSSLNYGQKELILLSKIML